jgi:glycosyltransferase involved in cell wall biosynthesis
LASSLSDSDLSNSDLSDSKISFRQFDLDRNLSAYEIGQVALDLNAWQPDKIAFIDHDPCPTFLIEALFRLNPDFQPELIFHIFGDFTLNASSWLGAEKTLRHYLCLFVCASQKQAKLLNQFFAGDKNPVHVIPFPVSENDYFYSNDLRETFRASLEVPANECLFLYSGRLSQQKNVLQLIRAFDLYQRQIHAASTLWLAGPLDDICNPYLGQESAPGLMAYSLQGLIQEVFPGERSEKIRYLGNLDPARLNKAYNAADVFVSLSTHNDEDYGMAPAEALMTGCACVLSDWGGYSSFKNIAPELCELIRVQTSSNLNCPSKTDVLKSLFAASEAAIHSLSRPELAASVVKNLSVKATASKIRSLVLNKESALMPPMSDLFRQLAMTFKINPKSPMGSHQGFSKLYRDVYDVYCN